MQQDTVFKIFYLTYNFIATKELSLTVIFYYSYYIDDIIIVFSQIFHHIPYRYPTNLKFSNPHSIIKSKVIYLDLSITIKRSNTLAFNIYDKSKLTSLSN